MPALIHPTMRCSRDPLGYEKTPTMWGLVGVVRQTHDCA